MTAGPDSRPTASSMKVEWTDVMRFVRQLSHDLRNHLNAVELQGAYIAELASDPELNDEIKRLRQMASQLGTTLQKLSVSVAPARPTLMSYKVADYLADLRQKVEADFPKEASAIDWDVQPSDVSIEIDPQLLEEALHELFANAFHHRRGEGRPKITARVEGNLWMLILNEPKETFDLPTANWGRQPLSNSTQGHYGLGLNRARVILESFGGRLTAHYDKPSATLVTTVTLPVATAIS